MLTPESQFERELKISIAAQDSHMVGFYEIKMQGYTTAVDWDQAFTLEEYDPKALDNETRHIYGLTDDELAVAKARCIGSIAGVKTGKEHFNGKT